jgi:hypothetical protein
MESQMNERKHSPKQHWPLRPSTTAYVMEGLTISLSELIQEAGHSDQRELKQLSGLSLTLEQCASKLAHWFASRPPEDHDQLEELMDRSEDFGDR